MFYRHPCRGEFYWIERFHDKTIMGTPPLPMETVISFVDNLFRIRAEIEYSDRFFQELEPLTREQFERMLLLGPRQYYRQRESKKALRKAFLRLKNFIRSSSYKF
ncbi:MAG: hypothetical protein QHH02_00025 [Syntrophomonadaceae bacterium]|nr:hypothetical protein [Syntrophomonadaceae bacterium]